MQREGHQWAANSLLEGMEEILTKYRLRVDKELGRNFRATNIMEHRNSQLNASVRTIERWVYSDQCFRWVTMVKKEAELRLKPSKQCEQSAY